jgi:Ca2+-binding EF-hand superfamily protein
MQISSASTTYSADQAQRLLSMLFQAPSGTSGQEVPSSTSDTDAAAPTSPAPDQVKLATDTLSGLLAAQQSQPPSASDLAQQMISALDTDGDGSLSADEITKALGSDSGLSADQVTQAVNQLDTNGDGKLSADELASGIQTAKAHGGGHHHHHHAEAASSSDLASQLIAGADTSGDGALSADEIEKALGLDGSTASSGSATDAFSQAFASLDTNGDGSLSASELTAGIDAFRAAHHHGDAAAQAQTNQTSVTA